jgi:Rrf2 family protein
MKISKKAYYGLRALVGIAHYGEISAHALAREESLPEDYLHKILQQLKKVGIVSSEKGAAGGYALDRCADTISVWEVIRALDGEMTPFPAPKMSSAAPYPKLTHCQTSVAWRLLNSKIIETFSAITISDLISQPASNHQSPNSKIQKIQKGAIGY